MRKKSLLLLCTCLLTVYGFAQQPTPGGPFIPTSFMPKKADSTGIYPHCVVFGDFNGDGKPDLFVSRGSSTVAAVIPNISTSGNIVFGPNIYLNAPVGTGLDQEGAAVGDLDGDGKPDIALTSGIGQASVSIYRNTSVGAAISFAGRLDLAVVNGPYGVTIGDLDGDGKPDLVVANTGGNQLSFFRNLSVPGTLSFGARVDLTLGGAPYDVAIGDIDGDGKADLVVSSQGSSGALYVIQNTSTTGTFSFGTPIGVATGFGRVSLGDLDGDGKLDIAEAASSAVTVVRNQSTAGNFVFGGAQSFYNDSYSESVTIADLDGDGKKDLVCVNRFNNTVSVFHSTSSVGYLSFEAHVDYSVEADPIFVSAADIDGDGRIDLAVANSGSANISVLKNIIGANVAPQVTGFTPASGNAGSHVTISGVNLSGATAVSFGGTPAQSFTVSSATSIDAVVGVGASGSVGVTTPYGTVTAPGFSYTGPLITGFTPSVAIAGTVVTITGSNLTGATAVSFGGVAATTFTVNSSTSVTATVGAGASGAVKVTNPQGTVTKDGFIYGAPVVTSVVPGSGGIGSSVVITGSSFSAVASANTVYFGPVKATVTAASGTSLTVTVPAGAACQPVSVTTNGLTAYSPMPFAVLFPADVSTITAQSFVVGAQMNTGGYPQAMAVGDLDGDGKADVAVGNRITNTISVFQNKSVPSAMAFAPKIDLATSLDPFKMSVGDLDGDGKLDLVVIGFNSGNASAFSVFRNTSAGGAIGFATRVDYPTGEGSTDVVIADMNGDGRPDMLVPSGNSGTISIFLNTTTGGVISFAPPVSYYSLYHPQSLAAADLDGDGLPELLVVNFGGGDLLVYPNQSSGGILSFGYPADYVINSNGDPTAVAVADLDGDGKLDVGVANYVLNTLTLFRNISTPGNPALSRTQDLQHPPTTLNLGDLNGDGKPDIVSGEQLTGKFSVFQNISAGQGLFAFNNNIDFTPGNFDTYTAVADIDGDGKQDLLATTSTNYNLVIYRNRIGDPVIHSVSPDTAVKGQVVTISGSGFAGTKAVTFGGVAADSFKIVDGSTVRAFVGKGSSGDVVLTAYGTDTASGFHFVPQIRPAGSIVTCKGQPVVLGSTAPVGNQWYKDGAIMAGETKDSLTVTASGVYTVKVTANGITTGGDSTVQVTIQGGAAPVITRNANNDLVSSDTAGCQWMLNGSPIAGATGATYHPTESGSYTVQSTIAGCGTDGSMPFVYVASGMIDLGNGQFVNLYPNPVKNSLNIYWNISGMPMLDVVISDPEGRQMKTLHHAANGTVIDLTGLPKGVYSVRIYSNDNYKINKTVRILKVD
jgi:hypothetical protein